MLTDEELTTRLSAALGESLPELSYAGPVPRVRGSRAGLAATSAMAATATLVLLPAALQNGDGRAPNAVPSHDTSPSKGPRVVRTVDLGGVRLSFATTAGNDPGPLYAVLGNDLQVPPDAEKVDVDTPGQYWFAKDPGPGEPQVYVGHVTCPDTTVGCDGGQPRLEVYGILAPGWTRDQLMQLLDHPVRTARNGPTR